MALSKVQSKAVNLIYDFIDQDIDNTFYFFGYAGTGKTFVLSSIISDLVSLDIFDYVYICAPTHKALSVLQTYFARLVNDDTVEKKKTSFMTIHKLLNYRPFINQSNGSISFVPDAKDKSVNEKKRQLVIIDECSMISKDIYEDIQKYITNNPIKVIFLGDIMQLAPVGEKFSMIFSSIPINYVYHVLLEEIMRTNSSDIKDISTIVRSWNLQSNLLAHLVEKYNASKHRAFKMYHKKDPIENTRWFRAFIKHLSFMRFPIILSWRNSVSDNYNYVIRKYIHGTDELKSYMEDDCIVFNDYYYVGEYGEFGRSKSYYTSDMVKICNVKIKNELIMDWIALKIDTPLNPADRAFNDLMTEISKINHKYDIAIMMVRDMYGQLIGGEYQIFEIKTINLSQIREYDNNMENVKRLIQKFCVQQKSPKHSKALWEIYHKKLISAFAKVNFSFSMTIHKAQGSTFNYVYVDMDDIMRGPDNNEKRSLLYTAVTRTSKQLNILI